MFIIILSRYTDLSKYFYQTIGNNFENEETVQQAAPPMDSELNFNPVANSSPANQSHNQFKIQKKRGNVIFFIS